MSTAKRLQKFIWNDGMNCEYSTDIDICDELPVLEDILDIIIEKGTP